MKFLETHPACPEQSRCSCTRCALGSGRTWGSCRCSCSRRSRPSTPENTSDPRSLLLWRLSSESKEEGSNQCEHAVHFKLWKLPPPARLDWRRQRRRWRSSASGRWSQRWWWALGGRRCWSDCAQRSSNSAGTCGRTRVGQQTAVEKKHINSTIIMQLTAHTDVSNISWLNLESTQTKMKTCGIYVPLEFGMKYKDLDMGRIWNLEYEYFISKVQICI